MWCPACGETDSNKFLLTSRGKDWCTTCGWQEGTMNNTDNDKAARLEKMKNGSWKEWKA